MHPHSRSTPRPFPQREFLKRGNRLLRNTANGLKNSPSREEGKATDMLTNNHHKSVLKTIGEHGAVLVVRCETEDEAVNGIRAVMEGGIRAVEVTFTVPGAPGVIRRVKHEFGDSILLGAGTVLTPEQAEDAVDAGAVYLISPNTDEKVIGAAKRLGRDDDSRRVHADGSGARVGSGRGRDQDLPGVAGRAGVHQSAERAAAEHSDDPDRRRGRTHGRRFLQRGRVRGGRGRRAVRSQAAQSQGLRRHDGSREALYDGVEACARRLRPHAGQLLKRQYRPGMHMNADEFNKKYCVLCDLRRDLHLILTNSNSGL